jgi:hypothetical protein
VEKNIQIRQNTRQVEENTSAIRATAVHSGLSYLIANREATFADGEVASIYLRGLKDPSCLDDTELLRFRLLMANVVDAFFNTYSQTRATNFTPETWEAQAKTAQRVLRSKGGQWIWSNCGGEYQQAFRDEIKQLLGDLG